MRAGTRTLQWLPPRGHARGMKLITAVVKPDKLDHVIRAISGAGDHG
jgi:hypothetical protein